jgi:hypothetical protein
MVRSVWQFLRRVKSAASARETQKDVGRAQANLPPSGTAIPHLRGGNLGRRVPNWQVGALFLVSSHELYPSPADRSSIVYRRPKRGF